MKSKENEERAGAGEPDERSAATPDGAADGEAARASEDPDAESPAVLRERIAALEDKVVRARADLQNFRRQSEKRLVDERRFVQRDVYAQILPIVDTFGSAMSALDKGQDPANVLVGVRMIHQMLGKMLEDARVEPIPTEGRPFDPELHEAVGREATDAVDPNVVVTEVQKGYRLGDLVLRHARVIVAMRPAETSGSAGDADGSEND